MLEGRFDESSLMKKVVDAIKDSVKLCNFNCTEDGITVQAVDDSRVLLISLLIGEAVFGEYRCDRHITLGIDLESFNKIIRNGNSSDLLTIILEDSPDNVLIVFEDKNKDRVSEYSLKLMDLDSDFLNIDEMEFDATITMQASEFAKITRDLKTLSESLQIVVTKENVKFISDGDFGSGNVVLKSHVNMEKPEESLKIDMGKPINLTFGAKYISDIVKATALSDTVTIKLAEAAPALFEYKLSSGYLRYYLAPKFDEED